MERTYRVSDVVDSEFLRLPLSLLANPKYKQMSLEAKFIYALLLNRMTLSQRNNWINKDNEVYLIYTREEAANTLNISYRKAIAAFKELIQNGLLHEQRQGLGAPNLLYVLKAELTDKDATEFGAAFDGEIPAEEPENPDNSQICKNGISRHAIIAHQELPNLHIKNCQNGTSRSADTDISRTAESETSRHAESEHQDVLNLHTSKINSSNTDLSNTDHSQIDSIKIENSQSINPPFQQNGTAGAVLTDGQTDEEHILQYIFSKCELHIFVPNVQQMLKQAIERLFYSESFKIGDARLPKSKIRSYLWLLDADILNSVMESVKACESTVVNPMAYLMSTIINAICEKESSFLINLPPDYIRQDEIYTPPKNYNEGDEEGAFYANRPASNFGPAPAVRSSP